MVCVAIVGHNYHIYIYTRITAVVFWNIPGTGTVPDNPGYRPNGWRGMLGWKEQGVCVHWALRHADARIM